MSSITIQKISITGLDADAVVNAANEGLWAGGGVCGAMFREAGHEELEEACRRIGHCDTGSAVITPGFRLKARYIIHAVGPIYKGGFYGEPKLLYGAYYRSLELCLEKRHYERWIPADLSRSIWLSRLQSVETGPQSLPRLYQEAP